MSSLSYNVPRYVRSHRITAINLSVSGYQQQTVVSNNVVAHRNTQAWKCRCDASLGPRAITGTRRSKHYHCTRPPRPRALFGHGGHDTLGTISNSAQLRIADFRRLKDIHPCPYISISQRTGTSVTSVGPNNGYAGGRDKLQNCTIPPGQLTDSTCWGSLNALL